MGKKLLLINIGLYRLYVNTFYLQEELFIVSLLLLLISPLFRLNIVFVASRG